jgi:hypothetical protein
MFNDISSRPTRIAELIPLKASAEGHHDASKDGAGGVWFPSSNIAARKPYCRTPVIWRHAWPSWIKDKLLKRIQQVPFRSQMWNWRGGSYI